MALPAMWETRVRFLDGEDPLEKVMATHSSILEAVQYYSLLKVFSWFPFT